MGRFPVYNETMPAVPVTLPSTAVKDRRPQIGGVVLSVLLHALAAWLLLTGPWSRLIPTEPESMVIEMVMAPPPTSTIPPQVNEPTLPPAPPPPPPQLQEAPLAERSAPPPAPARPVRRTAPGRADDSGTTAAPQRAAPQAPPAPADSSAQSAPFESGRFRPDGASPDTVASQAVQDFVLAQIARHWIIDFRGARFRNIVLTGRFVLLPNGMLAAPFGKNDPWNISAMVSNYEQLRQPGAEAYRTAVETFLQAARQAQPFRLPPDGKGEVPRVLPMNFRLGDL